MRHPPLSQQAKHLWLDARGTTHGVHTPASDVANHNAAGDGLRVGQGGKAGDGGTPGVGGKQGRGAGVA